ncbi:hypothetical protein BC826DRAFT_973973 [Russula brevipes]|nr:hypothetical protein BC826DRAFT_973973 [Russula brevipes]
MLSAQTRVMSQEPLPWELRMCHPAVHDAPATRCARCACRPLCAMRLPSSVRDVPAICCPRCACHPLSAMRLPSAIRDAPAFGQPARSTVRRRLLARLCRGGSSCPGSLRALCPLCAMRLRLGNLLAAPFDVGHAHSAQIVGEVMSLLFPSWELQARVVPLGGTVWVTKVTVVVWAAYSSGGGDVDSAAGRQRRGRQEKRRPSPNDRGSWQGREATEGRCALADAGFEVKLTLAAARCWRSTTRLMGGGGDLAMAWNEAEKNGKEQGGAQLAGALNALMRRGPRSSVRRPPHTPYNTSETRRGRGKWATGNSWATRSTPAHRGTGHEGENWVTKRRCKDQHLETKRLESPFGMCSPGISIFPGPGNSLSKGHVMEVPPMKEWHCSTGG